MSAGSKVSVVKPSKRGGKVYAKASPDISSVILMIKLFLTPFSNRAYWRGYNNLDVSEFKYERINHPTLFVDKENHINGIENAWNPGEVPFA